jgi:heat shock protein 1/8
MIGDSAKASAIKN